MIYRTARFGLAMRRILFQAAHYKRNNGKLGDRQGSAPGPGNGWKPNKRGMVGSTEKAQPGDLATWEVQKLPLKGVLWIRLVLFLTSKIIQKQDRQVESKGRQVLSETKGRTFYQRELSKWNSSLWEIVCPPSPEKSKQKHSPELQLSKDSSTVEGGCCHSLEFLLWLLPATKASSSCSLAVPTVLAAEVTLALGSL